MNINIQKDQQKKELCKPNGEAVEEATSKEFIDIISHNQRTAEKCSILKEETQSARKQMNYSHDALNMAQEEGIINQKRDPNKIINPKLQNKDNKQDKRGHESKTESGIESLLEEEVHQASDGRNILNRQQKVGSGNSDAGKESMSEEDELNKHRDIKVSDSNVTLEEEICQIADARKRQEEVSSMLHKVEIKNSITKNDVRNSSQGIGISKSSSTNIKEFHLTKK